MDYKLNFRPSPHDSRDFQLRLSSPLLTLPNSVDLSSKCTSVKNQGSVGSCTAHASIALLEYNYRRDTNDTKNDVYSERFTYYTTRVDIAGWPSNEDNGAYLRDTLKSLVKFGCCLEQSCEYLTNNTCNYMQKPSTKAYEEALEHQALTYLNIPTGKPDTLDKIKQLLSNGYPFVGGFICYPNLNSGINGVVPLPKGDPIGGHAVCFVGYDDKTQLLKFKNSWGSSWGDKGYGYLPYKYLTDGLLDDLWTIYTQENGVIKSPTNLLQDAIRKGLVAISEGKVPEIPTEFKKETKLSLSGFFNRIIIMKSQVK